MTINTQNYKKISFKKTEGFYLFELPNFRDVERKDLHNRIVHRRVSSYVLYDASQKKSKIINYEEAKASVYDENIRAYVIDGNEKFLVAEDDKCHYMNIDGETFPYDGSIFTMRNTPISKIPLKEKTNHRVIPKTDLESDRLNLYDLYEAGSNILKFPDGRVVKLPYKIKNDFGKCFLCYKEIFDRNGRGGVKLYGVCDGEGKVIIEPRYSMVYVGGLYNDNYYEVVQNEKCGVIDASGRELIPPVFESIDDCDGNVAVVDKHKKLVSVNDLRVLYEAEEGLKLEYIVDGYIRVLTDTYDGDPKGLLDSTGKFFETKRWGYTGYYDEIGPAFYDNLLPVLDSKRGYGYVRKDDGYEVIECKYNEIHNFENGRAWVRYDTDYRYIDTLGNIFVKDGEKEVVIPKKYDWAYDFEGDIAIVQKRKKYGLIDRNLNEIFPCVFDSEEQLKKAYLRVQIKMGSKDYQESLIELEFPIPYEENRLFGYKRIDGKIICPPIFADASQFVEGLSKVRCGGKFGFLNKELEFVIPPIYNYAESFSEGSALVNLGYINKKGELVIDPGGLESLKSFCGGVVLCERNCSRPGRENDDYILTKRIRGFQ